MSSKLEIEVIEHEGDNNLAKIMDLLRGEYKGPESFSMRLDTIMIEVGQVLGAKVEKVGTGYKFDFIWIGA